jgi:hypothetical protein
LRAIGKPAGAIVRDIRKIRAEDGGQFRAARAAREREYGVARGADLPGKFGSEIAQGVGSAGE